MEASQNRGRKLRRRIGWSVTLIAVLVGAVMVGLAVFSLRGPVPAPEWVKSRVSQNLAMSLPQARIGYDNLLWQLSSDGRPIIFLQHTQIRTNDDTLLLELSELEANLSLAGLMRGRVQPKSLSFSGVFMDAVRQADGAFSITLPNNAGLAGTNELRVGIADVLDQPVLQELKSLSVDAVTLRYEDRRAKRAWTVDGGRFRMQVDDQALDLSGDFALLGGGTSVATLEANAKISLTGPDLEYGIKITDMPSADLATQQASLFWLSVLDAPISGSLRGGIDSRGISQPVAAALRIGEGAIKPSDETRAIPFKSADAYFTYDPVQEIITFDQISVNSDWIRGNAEGAAELTLEENGLPSEIYVTLGATDLIASESGPWAQDIAFKDARVAFGLKVDPFRLMIDEASIRYKDATLTAGGDILGDDSGWAYRLGGNMPKVTHEDVVSLWPENLAPRTRAWMSNNVSQAIYQNVRFDMEARPDQPVQTEGFADIGNARITFAKGVSPGQQVNGTIRLKDRQFEAVVESGVVAPFATGGLDAAGTVFRILDVTDKPGSGRVELRGRGALTDVLGVLDQIPGINRDEDFSLTGLADGQAVFAGSLEFPLGRKPEPGEFRYDIAGTLTDVTSETLFPNHEIAASELLVAAENNGIVVKGPAVVDGVALDAIWNSIPSLEGPATSALTGEIELSQNFVTQFGLGLPDGTVSGQGVGTLFLDLTNRASPGFELISDLSGVGFDLGFVGWRKPEDVKGDLFASGTLGAETSIDVLEMSAPGLEASGSVRMNDDGSLDAVQFDRMRLGKWLNSAVRIQGNGEGQAADLYLSDGFVDAQELTEATGGIGGSTGQQVQGRVFASNLELFVSDFLTLSGFDAELDLGRNLQGEFSGVLNDTAEIGGTISTSAEGRRVITASADDAGAVFSALGLLDQASQGSIIAELTEKDMGYGGRFVARDMRLLQMPLLGALLNAVSIVGLFDQLSFDGIAFSEVEGEFYFTETEFILTRASATGPSIGLSLDGRFDFETEELDLQGVLTPVYLVNGIGELLTRKGEGVIGFNYTVTGNADDPQISVNPLSALTPSIFRDLFRRPAPDAPE
ncbi:MAG: AsmA-like C-terminal region-containing protein [Paracoccaceae bacterium]|jgi:hypothetical protein|nr:AsmA-like C-terminal region-containing protein [Paracoccaceae bacterium]MDP7185797.1 AsmA-like C-terminal region-containing protein [Paracoccaceae bacterium]